MLETVNLKAKLDREQYRKTLPSLQRRLYDLEKAGWDNRVSSMFIFEGWDAAGKGSAIGTVTQRLDPRGFKLYAITPPRTYEQQRPWLWRYWLKVPNRGEMVLFDQSWYRQILDERIENKRSSKRWRDRIRDIVDFERTLSDDGTVLQKFFFHISRKEQKKRFREIESTPLESWRVTREDWARHLRYDEYLERTEELLETTESDFAPWAIIEATSKWHARKRVFEVMIARLEERLGKLAPPAARDGKDADLRAAMDSIEGGR